MRFIDISGERFGRLVAIKLHSKSPIKYLCKCDCGIEKIICSSSLRSGVTKSCGCYQRELIAKLGKENHLKATKAITKHGHKRKNNQSRTYSIWCSMKTRATNKNYKQANDYVLRGISICESWLNFENFLDDMGEAPDGLQIDRIDNDKGYSPDNCRWVTPSQNCLNRRPKLKACV